MSVSRAMPAKATVTAIIAASSPVSLGIGSAINRSAHQVRLKLRRAQQSGGEPGGHLEVKPPGSVRLKVVPFAPSGDARGHGHNILPEKCPFANTAPLTSLGPGWPTSKPAADASLSSSFGQVFQAVRVSRATYGGQIARLPSAPVSGLGADSKIYTKESAPARKAPFVLRYASTDRVVISQGTVHPCDGKGEFR